MPHATHKARRMGASEASHVPLKRPRSRFERQALLVVSVGFTMIVIISLYAATFRAPYPARTTVQVVLARGMGVEIDCIARR